MIAHIRKWGPTNNVNDGRMIVRFESGELADEMHSYFRVASLAIVDTLATCCQLLTVQNARVIINHESITVTDVHQLGKGDVASLKYDIL